MSFGRRVRQALEERLEREALGLKPRRRRNGVGRSRRPLQAPALAPLEGHAFATCQRCGAMRIPNETGKLPPHRCPA